MTGLIRIVALLGVLSPACAAGGDETTLVGSRVGDAESRLGIHLTSWRAAASPGYEVSCDLDHVVTLFGAQGTVCVVREGDRVAAIDLRINRCARAEYDALRRRVIEVYGLSGLSDDDVYVVLERGVVHLRPSDGDSARLVLTDAAYGKLYATGLWPYAAARSPLSNREN